MTKQEIEKKCAQKKDELIEKYFGNLVHEAAIERPETIGTYTDLLPKQIEEEYYEYLRGLWVETHPEGPRFEDIIDKRHLSELFTENDRIGLKRAYDDATRRTLWERLSNFAPIKQNSILVHTIIVVKARSSGLFVITV